MRALLHRSHAAGNAAAALLCVRRFGRLRRLRGAAGREQPEPHRHRSDDCGTDQQLCHGNNVAPSLPRPVQRCRRARRSERACGEADVALITVATRARRTAKRGRWRARRRRHQLRPTRCRRALRLASGLAVQRQRGRSRNCEGSYAALAGRLLGRRNATLRSQPAPRRTIEDERRCGGGRRARRSRALAHARAHRTMDRGARHAARPSQRSQAGRARSARRAATPCPRRSTMAASARASTRTSRAPGSCSCLASVDGGPRPLLEALVFAGMEPPPHGCDQQSARRRRPRRAQATRAPRCTRWSTPRARANAARPLARDARLETLAQEHAEAMRRARKTAHDTGDGDLNQRLERAGLELSAGENVAHAGSAALAQRALWASPSHRENLLFRGFDVVGIGVAPDADGTLWVCQVFASQSVARTSQDRLIGRQTQLALRMGQQSTLFKAVARGVPSNPVFRRIIRRLGRVLQTSTGRAAPLALSPDDSRRRCELADRRHRARAVRIFLSRPRANLRRSGRRLHGLAPVPVGEDSLLRQRHPRLLAQPIAKRHGHRRPGREGPDRQPGPRSIHDLPVRGHRDRQPLVGELDDPDHGASDHRRRSERPRRRHGRHRRRESDAERHSARRARARLRDRQPFAAPRRRRRVLDADRQHERLRRRRPSHGLPVRVGGVQFRQVLPGGQLGPAISARTQHRRRQRRAVHRL